MRIIPTCGLALLCSVAVDAQNVAPPKVGDHFLNMWSGASFATYSPTAVGHTPRRRLYLGGIRSTWIVATRGPFAISQTFDAIPLALLTGRQILLVDVRQKPAPVHHQPGGGTSSTPATEDTLTYGGGGAMGAQLLARVGSRMNVVLDGSVGGLRFDREIPGPGGKKFNFTAEAGSGVALRLTDRYGVSAHVTFHHMSNGNASVINPGVDGFIYYLELSRSQR